MLTTQSTQAPSSNAQSRLWPAAFSAMSTVPLGIGLGLWPWLDFVYTNNTEKCSLVNTNMASCPDTIKCFKYVDDTRAQDFFCLLPRATSVEFRDGWSFFSRSCYQTDGVTPNAVQADGSPSNAGYGDLPPPSHSYLALVHKAVLANNH